MTNDVRPGNVLRARPTSFSPVLELALIRSLRRPHPLVRVRIDRGGEPTGLVGRQLARLSFSSGLPLLSLLLLLRPVCCRHIEHPS